MTYGELVGVALVRAVELLHEVLGVLDDDLVGLPVQPENHRDHVLLAVLHPPRRELQVLDLVCSQNRSKVETIHGQSTELPPS